MKLKKLAIFALLPVLILLFLLSRCAFPKPKITDNENIPTAATTSTHAKSPTSAVGTPSPTSIPGSDDSPSTTPTTSVTDGNITTPTPTPSGADIPSKTPTRTPDGVDGFSITPTRTPSGADGFSITATRTPTPGGADGPSKTPTRTPSGADRPSQTPTPTISADGPSQTPTPTISRADGPSKTPTRTPGLGDQPSKTPTRTPSSADQPSKTPTRTPSGADGFNITPTRTPTPGGTDAPSKTPTRTPTPTKTVEGSSSDWSTTQTAAPSWLTRQGDPVRTGKMNLAFSTALEPKWVAQPSQPWSNFRSPIVADHEMVVVADDDSRCLDDIEGEVIEERGRTRRMCENTTENAIYAFNLADGTQKWHFATAGSVVGYPQIVTGRVYAATFQTPTSSELPKISMIYCLDGQDGSLLWQYTIQDTQVSELTVDEGVVVVPIFEKGVKKIIALDALTGASLWTTKLDARISAYYYNSVAISEGRIFVALDEDLICALNLHTGDFRWQKTTASSFNRFSPPIAVDGRLFILGDSYLYTFDANTGELLWKVRLDYHAYQEITLDPLQKTLFITSSNRTLAISAVDGTTLWTVEDRCPEFYHPVIIGNNNRLISPQGIMDQATGELLWSTYSRRNEWGLVCTHHAALPWSNKQSETRLTYEEWTPNDYVVNADGAAVLLSGFETWLGPPAVSGNYVIGWAEFRTKRNASTTSTSKDLVAFGPDTSPPDVRINQGPQKDLTDINITVYDYNLKEWTMEIHNDQDQTTWRVIAAGISNEQDTRFAKWREFWKIEEPERDEPLADGVWTLRLTATDTSGLTSSVEMEQIIDTTGPMVQIISPEDGTTLVYERQIHLEGIASDTNEVTQVRITSDGGRTYTTANGTDDWHLTLPITVNMDGKTITYHAVATDNFGNETRSEPVKITFIVDTTGPMVQIISPEDGSTIDNANIRLDGIASDMSEVTQVRVTYDGGQTYITATGTNDWTVTLPITEMMEGKTITFHAVATDSLGNETRSEPVKITFPKFEVNLQSGGRTLSGSRSLFVVKDDDIDGDGIDQRWENEIINLTMPILELDEEEEWLDQFGTAHISAGIKYPMAFFVRVTGYTPLFYTQNNPSHPPYILVYIAFGWHKDWGAANLGITDYKLQAHRGDTENVVMAWRVMDETNLRLEWVRTSSHKHPCEHHGVWSPWHRSCNLSNVAFNTKNIDSTQILCSELEFDLNGHLVLYPGEDKHPLYPSTELCEQVNLHFSGYGEDCGWDPWGAGQWDDDDFSSDRRYQGGGRWLFDGYNAGEPDPNNLFQLIDFLDQPDTWDGLTEAQKKRLTGLYPNEAVWSGTFGKRAEWDCDEQDKDEQDKCELVPGKGGKDFCGGLEDTPFEPENCSSKLGSALGQSDDWTDKGPPDLMRTVLNARYRVTFTTGTQWFAGTDADLLFYLVRNESTLSPSTKRTIITTADYSKNWDSFPYLPVGTFENGNVDTVYLDDNRPGPIRAIQVQHDNTGFGPDWYLARVVVTDLLTGETWIAEPNRWITRSPARIPLVPYQPNGTRQIKYQVTVRTGELRNAGTDGEIFIQLIGVDGTSSSSLKLDDPDANDFERDTVKTYTVTSKDVGVLDRIVLILVPNKSSPDWYCEEVTVRNMLTGQVWTFPVEKWLGRDDGPLSVEVNLNE